jgi:glycosyltransferase involved in cell wall biosynthesis
MSLLVIIPCFNEGLSVGQTIQSIVAIKPDAVIVVVDNASTDDTAAKAKSLGAIVLTEPRPGKGFAFRRGLTALHPGVTSVLMVDGDATYGMESLKEACEMVGRDSYDMVIGVRYQSTKLSQKRSDQYRRGHILGNYLLSWIFRRLFKLELNDTLSGWRVFTPAYLYSFPGGNSGFELETELNAHARSINALIGERPISYHGRLEGSESKLSTYKDGWKILRRNIQLVKDERPLIAFGVLALPWLAVSSVLLALVFKDYVDTGLVPRFPSLIAAVGAIAIAAQLWVTGMVLERVRLNRNILLQTNYRAWVLNQK